jgi:hypothetical protein
VSLVLAIVLEATSLGGQGADEVGVLDAGLLEFLPEVGTPTSLSLCQWSEKVLGPEDPTGLPVMESPRAIILTVDCRSARSAGAADTTVVKDKAATRADPTEKRIVRVYDDRGRLERLYVKWFEHP